MVNGELCIKAVIVNLLVLVAWITVVIAAIQEKIASSKENLSLEI